MNTSGVYLGEFSIASGSTQGRLTKGPDGNPWFTESSANAIDSFVTSTSLFTPAQTIPTAASSPFGIASGPDGNLWFTERSGDKIGVYVRLEQTATPSSISFTAAGQTQTFSVSETNYTSDFKVSGCPTSIATVSPTGYAKKFTVKAVAAGTCTLTVSDTNGNGSPVSVVVTTTSVQIQ